MLVRPEIALVLKSVAHHEGLSVAERLNLIKKPYLMWIGHIWLIPDTVERIAASLLINECKVIWMWTNLIKLKMI